MNKKLSYLNLNETIKQREIAVYGGHIHLRKDEIKNKFVQYYKSLGFQLLPRASMLHSSTPMSFVMSAGLAQVETLLANTKERSHNKFVLVQDCFRHFDIETVGLDETHLSLFEMPGAFFFGQDRKERIIQWMWTLVTQVLKINPKHLYVSYFSGGKLAQHDIPADEETYKAWQNLGISEDRLIGLGIKDNYWIQGSGLNINNYYQRKCGPNTELFYDLGIQKSCNKECKPGCRCGRFLEFANSLFISNILDPDTDRLLPLEDPFAETVIGTERVAMILQRSCSVFETEEYNHIISIIDQYIDVDTKNLPIYLIDESKKVIADHIKALYILIMNGAPPPGKNGRERIIKILIRRLITRIIVLGIRSQEFIPTILSLFMKNISNANKESNETLSARVNLYIQLEAERFQKTIQRGQKEIDNLLQSNSLNVFNESLIVNLEKEWGLPFQLIAIKLHQKGIYYDYAKYLQALADWKSLLLSSNNKFI